MVYAGLLDSALALLSTVVNNVVVAAIILLIGMIAGRLLGKLVERILVEVELNRIVSSGTKVSLPADEAIGTLVQFFIYFLAIILALDTLSLQSIFFNIISVLLVVIIFLSVILSLKDFVPNVFAGVFIHQRGIARPGDVIKINDLEGKIISIDLVDTKVKSKLGDVFFVPNIFMMKNVVIVKKSRSRQ